MNVYIDESGNTGETLNLETSFNFSEQPFYVLSGILLDDSKKEKLEEFIKTLKQKFRVQGNELKAKNLYQSTPRFIHELFGYLMDNDIPIFCEVMDKKYFLTIYLVDYFFLPYYSIPLTDQIVYYRKQIGYRIHNQLDDSIYKQFINAVKDYTNDSLEKFQDLLIKYCVDSGFEEHISHLELTKSDYFELKAISADDALKKHLPLPDKNPNEKLIHLLPNYNAFSNLTARVQKYCNENKTPSNFNIIHDNQEQFYNIFQNALDLMKNENIVSVIENTSISERSSYNVEKEIQLMFVDSKKEILIQVADLISGVFMRYTVDVSKRNMAQIEQYKELIGKIISLTKDGTGVNVVAPPMS